MDEMRRYASEAEAAPQSGVGLDNRLSTYEPRNCPNSSACNNTSVKRAQVTTAHSAKVGGDIFNPGEFV